MNQAMQAAYRVKYAPKDKKPEAVSAWRLAVVEALNG